MASLRLRAFVVDGDSMLPSLRPGDCLLVRVGVKVRPGDVVVARHPMSNLLLVKRATGRVDGGWWLLSDNADVGLDDSRAFGAVPDSAVVGRVWFRYYPWRFR
jgi:nickel-type superoxide dismutase maturation protease